MLKDIAAGAKTVELLPVVMQNKKKGGV